MAKTTANPSAKPAPIRVFLVDDHPLVRQGLAEVLKREPDLEICGEAEDRQQALDAMRAAKPDLAIIDLALKNSHGLELIKDIRALFPKVLMLVVSMHDELLNAERALRAGARGYITKAEATVHVMQAVRKVLQGEVYVSQDVSKRMVENIAFRPQPAQARNIASLSDRELQVLELIGQGLTRNEIASRLFIAISTLETHRARIQDKLGLKDAHELRKFAIRFERDRGLAG